jgi:hypothetical protein
MLLPHIGSASDLAVGDRVMGSSLLVTLLGAPASFLVILLAESLGTASGYFWVVNPLFAGCMVLNGAIIAWLVGRRRRSRLESEASMMPPPR